jgi:hypothetical protein
MKGEHNPVFKYEDISVFVDHITVYIHNVLSQRNRERNAVFSPNLKTISSTTIFDKLTRSIVIVTEQYILKFRVIKRTACSPSTSHPFTYTNGYY